MPETPQPTLNLSLPDMTSGIPECPLGDSKENEDLLKQELARLTPTNEKLLALAEKSPPPPPEWLDEDEEIPF